MMISEKMVLLSYVIHVLSKKYLWFGNLAARLRKAYLALGAILFFNYA